jgi:hypothetical protein
MKQLFRAVFEIIFLPYVGTLVFVLSGLVLAAVLPNSTSIERLVGPPVFGLPILIGALSGYYINRRRFCWTAILAWIIPASVFWLAYKDLTQPQNTNPQPWLNLFGVDCGASECLYELLATTPLICSVAYGVTALALRLLGKKVAPSLRSEINS